MRWAPARKQAQPRVRLATGAYLYIFVRRGLVWRRPRWEVIVAKPKVEEDPEERIEALKRQAEELCGGQMEVGTLDDYPAETEEAFWNHVVDYEKSSVDDPLPAT